MFVQSTQSLLKALLLALLLLSVAAGKVTVTSTAPPDNLGPSILSTKEMNKIIYYFLSSAEKGQLKYTFTNDNISHYHVMRELIEAGYLYCPGGHEKWTSYSDKPDRHGEVTGIRITLNGREYLEKLRSKQFWPSVWRLVWKFIFWVLTIAISAIIAAQATKLIDKMNLFEKSNKSLKSDAG